MAKKKILVVDDSRTALMMAGMLLGRSAYDVVTAADGDEGVAKALAERPDLILMDVMMPKLDGFEACRRLRARAATRHIPIIMITTRGEASNVETGFECGCTEYVTKPIDSVELLAKVRSCLGD